VSLSELASAARPQIALADAQYWNEEHIDEVIANKHVQVLIHPTPAHARRPGPGWTGGRYTFMRSVLASEVGEQLYRNENR